MKGKSQKYSQKDKFSGKFNKQIKNKSHIRQYKKETCRGNIERKVKSKSKKVTGKIETRLAARTRPGSKSEEQLQKESSCSNETWKHVYTAKPKRSFK